MNYLARHHVAVADPFNGGHSAACLGAMLNLTRGIAWPWISGGVALMRRELYPTPGEWQYCGIAQGADTQISNYPGMTHTAGQGYQYAAVTMLGNGFISRVSKPIRIDFDDEGNRITPALPMWPVNVSARAIAGGKYKISFEYEPEGEGASPTDFQVFEGADAASVDYETPLTDSETGLAYVSYTGARRVFTFTTAAFGDLTTHVFAVRARSSEEVAEKNTYTTDSKKALATVPDAAPAALRVHVESRSRTGM